MLSQVCQARLPMHGRTMQTLACSLAIDSQPTGTKYARSVSVGGLYSNPGDASARAFLRGGTWNDGSLAGVLTLNLSGSPSTTHPAIGFRVAR